MPAAVTLDGHRHGAGKPIAYSRNAYTDPSSRSCEDELSIARGIRDLEPAQQLGVGSGYV